MERIKLKIKNWPFKLGEKTQLVWIGEPFKYNNKWMIDTYFNNGKITKKVIQDWANIHFLSIDKYYTDGDLNSGEVIDEFKIMNIIDIDLSGIMPKYNENDWNIKMSYYKSKSRTFNFYKNGVLYSIPLVEIIRSVLAPNSFMLNTILYNDIWEDYFTYEINNKTLNLYFNDNYRRAYLKGNYYNHLAWVIGNKNILNMISSIGYNISIQNKLLFDFNMNSFKFTARVRKNKTGYTVLEIIKVKEKYIEFDELKIHHPSFEEQQNSHKTKLRTYTRLNAGNDRILDNNTDGSTKLHESIKEEVITHEYIEIPEVRRKKLGYSVKRTKEDENTKKFIIEDDKVRTLADEDGFNKVNGIEMDNVDVTKVNGELKEFIEVLNILRSRDEIKGININIVELPLGRKFSYLSSSLKRRKCILAQIIICNDTKYVLIDVERQKQKLSMLLININYLEDWKGICSMILKGLVECSGKWNSEVLNILKRNGINSVRLKHISKNNYRLAEYILEKINSIENYLA